MKMDDISSVIVTVMSTTAKSRARLRQGASAVENAAENAVEKEERLGAAFSAWSMHRILASGFRNLSVFI